jgi:hypothetical protein
MLYTHTHTEGNIEYRYRFYITDDLRIVLDWYTVYVKQNRTWIPTHIYARNASNGYQYMGKRILSVLDRSSVYMPEQVKQSAMAYYTNKITLE